MTEEDFPHNFIVHNKRLGWETRDETKETSA